MLASNVPGAVDEVINGADYGANVVAKEIEADTGKFLDSVKKTVLQRSYDISIIIPEDYVMAGILLNREKEIFAAICSSEEDLQAAAENNANVIILKSMELKKAPALLSAVIGNAGGRSQSRQMQKPEQDKPLLQQERKPVQQKKQEFQEPEKGFKGKGVFKRLRYSLGIDD